MLLLQNGTYTMTHDSNGTEETTTLSAIRKFLLGIFLAGVLGGAADLLLIGHTEEAWQFVPLVLMCLGFLSILWAAFHPVPTSLRVFRGLMIVFLVGGAAGLYLHYRGNIEFEQELYPSVTGFELFWQAVKGAAPPTLAPATMIFLGLVGLAYAYRIRS